MSLGRWYVISARAGERLLGETGAAGCRVATVGWLLGETDSVGGRVEVSEWAATCQPVSRRSEGA